MSTTYEEQLSAAVKALRAGWFKTLDGVCKALDVHPLEVRARLDPETAQRLGAYANEAKEAA
jgi:hypothetical protein